MSNIQIESRDRKPYKIGASFIFLTHKRLRVGEQLPVVYGKDVINIASVKEIKKNPQPWKSKNSYVCVVIG